MAKKIEVLQEFAKSLENSKVINVNVQDEMKKSFISYAMAVNVSRAIPDVRDGLKPVHRRILYAMGTDLKIYYDKPHRKCARIVGEVMGKYHPHGDSAIYDALVRLAQDFSMRYPLVDGQGNFGSIDGDGAAAQRYTEARLSAISTQMLAEIEKNTVDFYPNFDESEMQPTVLPSRFPNLLVNGADGIAVGMATNIPPHNLCEVIDATVALIDNEDITIEELMQYIPAPDYPTGGLLLGRAAVKNAYRTGRGGVVLRAKTEIEELPNGKSRIIATELPYQVNKSKLIETIANLVKDKKIEGISDVKDESDREGLRIVIDIKKDNNPQVVLNHLYKQTQLQVKNGITLLALVAGEPKVLNLREIIYHYIEHQKEIIVRRTRFDLEKAEEKAHILEGLMIALANIDEVIAIIKASKDRQDSIANLMASFVLSEKQAQAVVDTRLHRLTSLEVEKIQNELSDLRQIIARFIAILSTPEMVAQIIKEELLLVKDKYGDARRTEITIDYGEIDIEDLIEKEDILISMTHQGYIKRLGINEYKAQKRGGVGSVTHKTKEEDFVEEIFVSSTHDELWFFSNFGKVYSIKGYEIPEGLKYSKGRAMVNLLQLSEGEKIQTVIPVSQKEQGYLIIATKQGYIKKTKLSEFESIRKGGKIAISLNAGDSVICAKLTDGNAILLIGSTDGKAIKFSEQDVRPMGRTAAGVKSIKLGKQDFVVDMLVEKEGCDVLTICENGYGKRTLSTEYKVQNRAGKGVKVCQVNEKTGKLISIKAVTLENDIMVITDSGIIIRFGADEISRVGRDTQGVRLMRVKDDCKVASVAICPKMEEMDKESEFEQETTGEFAPQDIQQETTGEFAPQDIQQETTGEFAPQDIQQD